MSNNIYQTKAEELVKINNMLKEINKKSKGFRDKKKLLESELIEYFENTNRDDPLIVGTQKIFFKKKDKKKGISKEVLDNSLKGVKNRDEILKCIENNREDFIDKKLVIKG